MSEPLHRRMRSATDAIHRKLERDLDWRAQIATLDGYRQLLVRLRGFHAAYEDAIGEALSDEAFLAPRRRLARLDSDLRALGFEPERIAALPRPPGLATPGPAAAMGALYVLEGSTLGGQVICREIERSLGLSCDATRYYRGHGERTGAMWVAFRRRLDMSSGDLAAEDAALRAGVATFEALADWLSRPEFQDDQPPAGSTVARLASSVCQ